MKTSINDYITKTNDVSWEPLTETGVDTRGIHVKSLRRDPTGRAPSFLLKFDPGAEYPYHNHPAGEELFVLEGSVVIEGQLLQKGDYLFTPPGFRHSVKSVSGGILLFIVPAEVEILKGNV